MKIFLTLEEERIQDQDVNQILKDCDACFGFSIPIAFFNMLIYSSVTMGFLARQLHLRCFVEWDGVQNGFCLR